MTLLTSCAGALVLALLAITQPIAHGGQEIRASASAGRLDVSETSGGPRVSGSSGAAHSTTGNVQSPHRTCQPGADPHGYVNPLAGAKVVAKRIDQGVDYAGSGPLRAMGAARITYLATVATGWPGAFIEYQLINGAEAGCYVFYAEAVTPAPGLHVGEIVRAGQTIAAIVPASSTGIEIGWGAGSGTTTYAAQAGQWNAAHEANDIPSAPGLYFSALIHALGGPAGKVEG